MPENLVQAPELKKDGPQIWFNPISLEFIFCYYVSHGLAKASWYQMELRFNHFHPILHPVQCKEYIAAYQSVPLLRLVFAGEKVQLWAGVRQFCYR